jgi:hypothetical protein
VAPWDTTFPSLAWILLEGAGAEPYPFWAPAGPNLTPGCESTSQTPVSLPPFMKHSCLSSAGSMGATCRIPDHSSGEQGDSVIPFFLFMVDS